MNEWYVWTNRDTGVAGWARDETGSSPLDQSMDDLLRPLMYRRFPQLQPLAASGLQSTEGIPIVTAAWLPKAERWVFVLRGVGGGFGAAGTTQACAAPSSLPLAEAWPQFWTAVNADERVDLALLNTNDRQLRPSEGTAKNLESTLRLLLTGGPIVEVPVAPADTIRLYAVISRLIPESAARGWFWSTCHVTNSVMKEERILTGRWSDLLAEAWQRDYLRLTVGDRYLTEDKLEPLPREDSVTVAWVLDEATHDRFPIASSTAATVREALNEASSMRPLTRDDAEYFASEGGATTSQLNRLADDPGMIRQFSRQSPDLAKALLRQAGPGAPVYGMLALGVILSGRPSESLIRDLESETLEGGGPLTQSLQPHLVPGDNRKVADIALAAYRGDEAELLKARGWLQRLGLTADEAPELFVFDPREVARGADHDPIRAAGLIAEQSAPRECLRRVLKLMDPANPSTMLLLAIATANEADPKRIESVIPSVRLSNEHAIKMIEGLSDALDKASDDASHRDVVAVGFANWLARQGAPLTLELVVALLALSTGFESGDFVFRAQGTVVGGPTASSSTSCLPDSLHTSQGVRGPSASPSDSRRVASTESQDRQPANEPISNWTILLEAGVVLVCIVDLCFVLLYAQLYFGGSA